MKKRLYLIGFSLVAAAILLGASSIGMKIFAADGEGQSADEYYRHGVEYTDKAMYDKALACYNKSIALNPKFALAYYSRGIAYELKDMPEAAKADYEQASVLDPQLAKIVKERSSKGDNSKFDIGNKQPEVAALAKQLFEQYKITGDPRKTIENLEKMRSELKHNQTKGDERDWVTIFYKMCDWLVETFINSVKLIFSAITK